MLLHVFSTRGVYSVQEHRLQEQFMKSVSLVDHHVKLGDVAVMTAERYPQLVREIQGPVQQRGLNFRRRLHVDDYRL